MEKMVCKRLRFLREEKGDTQIQVSKNTGINNKTLSGYENGVSDPDLETLKILANYYLVSTDYLLGVTNDRASAIISDLDNKKVKYPDLTEAQKKMINRMDELSDEEQENLYDIADNFLKLSEKRIKK